MNKAYLLLIIALALVLAFGTISNTTAAPSVLSARFSKDAIDCFIWWFDTDWNPIQIDGTGTLLQKMDGGYVMTCNFTLDLNNNDTLLSREDFCSEDWASFMCRGDGALVDNRTTCNIEDAEVHNGYVLATPSGQGKFICHVK